MSAATFAHWTRYAGHYACSLLIDGLQVDVTYTYSDDDGEAIVAAFVSGADITQWSDRLGLPDLVMEQHESRKYEHELVMPERKA
jgi:hypothetical protein